MISQLCQIEYGSQAIEFAIVRRNRKTLEIAVEPDMSVVVTAPQDAPIEAIKAKVRRKAAWVRRQQRFFAQFLPRTPERFFIAGETHLYLGRQYRMKVIHDVQKDVKLPEDSLLFGRTFRTGRM
jgi:predicted metal-dependent hydrolase